jgi:hypothetical protein
MNQPERRKVPMGVREEVLDALTQKRYFIYPDGRRYLEDVGFDPAEFIVGQLIDYLREDKALYVLPENPSKCQCCLSYADDLVIHLKLTPKAETGGCFVRLAFHSHNTGHPPLPP